MRGPGIDLRASILERITNGSKMAVWTPRDFLDLGSREAVDQALHRMVRSGELRRIARGLYDQPEINALSKKPASPDPRAIIDALSRRDQARVMVDGMTAANDLGLSDAVPARIILHTDGRFQPIKLGNLTISFKPTAPSKLFWAGRPAMRVVQALHWLHEAGADTDPAVSKRLRTIFRDEVHGTAITEDLMKDMLALPAWMQALLQQALPAARTKKAIQKR